MGFAQPTRTRFPSQESVASLGGFFPYIFTAFCIQFPPRLDTPQLPASAMEKFAALFLLFLLFSALVLMFLPEKWTRKVIKIVFCIGPKEGP